MATLRELIDRGEVSLHTIRWIDEDGRTVEAYGPGESGLGATHIEVPATSWSDYHGSTYERANYVWFEQTLAENQPGSRYYGEDSEAISALVTLDRRQGFGAGRVLLALDEECPQAIVDVLDGLDDYPLIDDYLLTDVEDALFEEDWELWIERDLRDRVIEILTGGAEAGEEGIERLLADEDLREWYHHAEEARGERFWETESATSGFIGERYEYVSGKPTQRINGLTAVADDIADGLIENWFAPADPIPGQGTLPLSA